MDQYENEDWCDWIEKRVCAKGTLFGTLKFFGQTNFSDGLWCGISLDNPFGKNDGMVNGIRYFHCEPNFGIFVPSSKVVKMKESLIEIAPEDGLNQTFKIPGNKTKEFELNPADNVDLVGESFETNKNISNSKFDSEESLGILNPDLIENLEESWNSFSLEKSCPKHSNNEKFKIPPLNIETIFCDSLDFPLYASTPRLPNKKINVFSTELQSEDCNDPLEVTFDVDKLKNNPNLSSTSKVLELSSAHVADNISSCEFLNKTKTVLKNSEDNFNDTFNLSNIPECSESLEISKAENTQHLKTCVKNGNFALKQFKISLNSTFEKSVKNSAQNLSIVENISVNMNENDLENTFVINSKQWKESSSCQQNLFEYKTDIKNVTIQCVDTTKKLSPDPLSNNMNENKNLNSTFKSKKNKQTVDNELISETIKNKCSIQLNQANCKASFKKPIIAHKTGSNVKPSSCNLKNRYNTASISDKCSSSIETNVNTKESKISKLFMKQSCKEQRSIKLAKADSLEIPLIPNVKNPANCFKSELKDKPNPLIFKNKKNDDQENKLYSKTLPVPKLKMDKSAKVMSTFQQSKFSKTGEAASFSNKSKCLAKPLNGNSLNRMKCQSLADREHVNFSVQKVERRHSLNVGFKDKPPHAVMKPRYSMLPGTLKTDKLVQSVAPFSYVSKGEESVHENVQSSLITLVESSSREMRPPRKSMIVKSAISKLKCPNWKGKV